MKKDRQKEEQVFIETKSYSKASEILGMSRQRVQQIMIKSENPKVKEVIALIKKNKYPRTSKICLECRRVFDKEVQYGNNNHCKTCWNMVRKGLKPKLKSLKYPKKCKICGDELIRGHRIRGMCRKCYDSNFMRPKRKEIAKANTKRWYHNNREKAKDYRKENKDKIKAYQKSYYENNKEKINAYNKKYQQKKARKKKQRRLKTD